MHRSYFGSTYGTYYSSVKPVTNAIIHHSPSAGVIYAAYCKYDPDVSAVFHDFDWFESRYNSN